MSITSMGLLLFIFVGVIVYYCMPKKFQWVWLLILSLGYYACAGAKNIIFILITTVVTFLCTLWIENVAEKGKAAIAKGKGVITAEEKKKLKASIKRNKRLIVLLMLAINVGLLIVLKYFNFAADIGKSIIGVFTGETYGASAFTLLLPLGISYYTLQAISYVIDVYQGKYKADRNIFKFALYMTYFPQLLQGPINKHNTIAHQFFEEHRFSLQRIQFGLQLIFWGIFKKLVIADRAGIVASQVFNNPDTYGGIQVIYGVVFYTIQLYGDFSGGIDVVMGISEMFGIDMDVNFRQPFFSHSISEFWRRWHITLGAWMKDYIFYPFSLSKGMNKFGKFIKKHMGQYMGKVLPICVADIVVFVLVGLWHGAAWKFVMYGVYNGVIIAVSALLEPVYEWTLSKLHINSKCKPWRAFQIVRTTILVVIGMYFDANNFTDTLHLLKTSITRFSFSHFTDGSLLTMGLNVTQLLILAVGLVVLIIIDTLNDHKINVREAIAKKNIVIRWIIYIALIVSVIILGNVSQKVGGFIYAQY